MQPIILLYYLFIKSTNFLTCILLLLLKKHTLVDKKNACFALILYSVINTTIPQLPVLTLTWRTILSKEQSHSIPGVHSKTT